MRGRESKLIKGSLGFIYMIGGAGRDSLYASPLISDLEKDYTIVISSSVSIPEAVDALVSQCNGYVKAHVLDPLRCALSGLYLLYLLLTLTRSCSPP